MCGGEGAKDKGASGQDYPAAKHLAEPQWSVDVAAPELGLMW